MNKSYKILLFTLILSSCSFFKGKIDLKESVIINSTPNAAEVYSSSGELLGVTPLKLEQEKLKVIEQNSIISVNIRKMNYVDQQLTFKNLGVSEVDVKLNQISKEMFKGLISGPLSANINEILKKLIQAQEGILTKKFTTSDEILGQLIKDYPSISVFYTLQAAMDIQNKKYAPAKIMLEKSLMLDSSNELAKSYLNFINKRLERE